jgi:hypothetical protein
METLAERYDMNPKTVAKWKKRTDVHDALMRPKAPGSMRLIPEPEAIGVAVRRYSGLPLDAGIYVLQHTIPRLPKCSRWPPQTMAS